MLQACGTKTRLHPLRISREFTTRELADMRIKVQGSTNITESRGENIYDYHIPDIERIIAYLPDIRADYRKTKAKLLWNLLADLADKDSSKFSGMYMWFYYRPWQYKFKAQFVHFLNSQAWIPDDIGILHKPSEILFDDLDWDHNDFLLSYIKFKPPVIKELATEAEVPIEFIQLAKQAYDAGMGNRAVQTAFGYNGAKGSGTQIRRI